MDAPFRRKAFLNLERFSVIKIPPPLLLHSKYFYPIFQLSIYISSKNLSGNFQQRISKPSIYYTLCSIFKDQKLRSYNRVPHVVEDVERRGRAKPSARQLEIRLVRFLHQRLASHIPEKEQNRASGGGERRYRYRDRGGPRSCGPLITKRSKQVVSYKIGIHPRRILLQYLFEESSRRACPPPSNLRWSIDPSRISLLNVSQSTRIVNVRIPVNDPSEERTFANVRSSFAGR